MNTRQRIYETLDGTRFGSPLTHAVNVGLIILIVLNVLASVVATVKSVQEMGGIWLERFELVSVIIFSIEYALRLWACTASPRFAGVIRGRVRFALTPLAFIDLMVVLPYWLPFMGLDMRFLRSLRLFRAIRILKLGRYSKSLQLFGRVFKKRKEEIIAALFVLSLLLLIASSLEYYAEHEAQPDKFSSIPAAMWWGIMTLTTVGYGDTYPVTTLGKILASVIAILGIGMFALPAGILGAAFVEEIQGQNHDAPCCPHCGKPLQSLHEEE